MTTTLTPSLLLSAYCQGMFPMGDEASDEISWYSPDPRAIIPLDGLRVSRSLQAAIKREKFNLTTDLAFEAVIDACASRQSTWISEEIIRSYTELFKLGFAHSVETWLDGELMGGLYGVAIGGAFFGESMFHRATDASKIALVHLVDQLKARDFQLLDVQFLTEHLESLGAVEILRSTYLKRLNLAIESDARW